MLRANGRRIGCVLRTNFNRFVLWLVLNASPRLRWRRYRRAKLARSYLSGVGVEIGALHMPLRLANGLRVFYIDYLTVPEQREMYPELALLPLAPVCVVDDGEGLRSIKDASVDFVVANHVIEHCEDPVGTIENWLRVLRPGGVLFMAVPDQRRTFDRGRQPSSVEHVLEDYTQGPERSQRAHWLEICRHEHVPEDQVETHISERLDAREHPHYHVWTPQSFGELLSVCRREVGLPFELAALTQVGIEFVAILRKAS